jgi:pimeloyl-ACP methyl ester carboxylesterase
MADLLRFGAADPESELVALTTGRVHFLTMGSGPPVLLIHGAGGGGANWYRVIGGLASGFRVFAPDLPGFGLSEPIPPANGLGTQAADVLLEWAARLGLDRFDVVGTSFGGLVALRLAQRAPARVRRMVLLDSVGLATDVPAPVRAASLPLLGPVLLYPTRAGTAWLFRKLLVADASVFPAPERDALLNYLWVSALGGAAMLAAALRRFAGVRGQREVLTDEELTRIRHPALVLWGDRDRFLPLSHAQRAAALLPASTLHVIHGAGHSPNWERPGEVTERVLVFLKA